MEIDFQPNDKIAVLAWCLEVDKKLKRLILEYGKNIELGRDFFVEGSWDGDFSQMLFDEALFFLGTGGKIKNGSFILSTPNHVLERIYSIQTEEKIYFSNSLPFILERSSCRLDKGYFDYEKSFASILNGLSNYETEIPLAEEKSLKLYYYCNISIKPDFSIEVLKKNEIELFKSYEDYYNKITKITELIRSNSSDHSRRIKYDLITTISKGYDAAACSVIAKKVGCDTAVTFDRPEKYIEDSGEEIAKLLGISKIIKKNADEYLKNKDNVETEYISELGTGIVFSAFNEEFKNKVVFMGERGDKIWSKTWKDNNSDFRFKNETYAGTSMVESRINIGYMILPVPLIGASRWPSIHAITNSNELKCFSIGGGYDRPIPRRIIEDQGVPREKFGFKKYGAGFNYRFDNKKRLAFRMSSHTFDKFNSDYKSNWSFSKLRKFFFYLYSTKEYYINYLLKILKINFRYKVSQSMASNPTTPNDLFFWSVETMMKRYKS